jgi:hypothetical protein
VTYWRVCRNPCAQERSDPGEIQVGRNLQDKVLLDDNTVRITPIGYASNVLVLRVVCEGSIGAKLFETGLTLRAVTV